MSKARPGPDFSFRKVLVMKLHSLLFIESSPVYGFDHVLFLRRACRLGRLTGRGAVSGFPAADPGYSAGRFLESRPEFLVRS